MQQLSLAITRGATPSWWDALVKAGVAPSLILEYANGNFRNAGTNYALGDLDPNARVGTKPAWDANGDIVVTPTLTTAVKYNPVTH